jgi:hypothetical protein
MHPGVNGNGANVSVRPVTGNGYLSNSYIPLILFEESIILYLKQLNDYLRLRSTPKAYQLAVAYNSIIDIMCRQWLETVGQAVTDCKLFKSFLNTWWPTSDQSLVRCSLYQAKYNLQSNLIITGHFLKCATMSYYLEARPADTKNIEAIR